MRLDKDTPYDLVVIGGGPAGLTAGIYASRARMKALLLEKMACGGQMLAADVIENFPGFPDGVKGPKLAEEMAKQAALFGLQVSDVEAKSVTVRDERKRHFSVAAGGAGEIDALSIIVATGARWNHLGVPGEERLTGRGVSYCATCDGPLFKGKDVVVVGGGDTALEDALFLARFANKVTVVHRRGSLRAAEILQERARADKKIEFCLNAVVSEIIGQTRVDGVKVYDVTTSKENVIKTDGLFILIGTVPNSEIAKTLVRVDEKGYIITDDHMRASAEGIFACGDVRKRPLRQVVTAAGEGAVAATSAQRYVEHIKGID